MKVHKLKSFRNEGKSIVTSGTFDGIHIGHQKILSRLKEIARKEGGESIVLTFWPHPRLVLFPEQTDLKLLSTLEEKIALFERYGIDHLVIAEFSPEFAQLSSTDFIKKIIINQLKTKKLVIGYDHRFGKNREGSFEYLRQNATSFGFEVEEIPPQEVKEVTVSSTKIRQALAEGQVDIANKYLGHDYSLSGKVVHGDKIGRKLGYPTANLEISERFKLIPRTGIYAVEVLYQGGTYQGMLNIGNRPTLKENLSTTIEVNLFDFDQEIYGEYLTILLKKYLREELKFNSMEELRDQIARDKEDTLTVLNS
ncbi:bifunctional riboflavin kinase/FAD synthetase [Rapidithrix thailandica]|uniref:Riboflavin biosynthesis protein n=1 Tax=Rapidithrix thailandica TaxID=413964 RepID=A0AAW9SFP7_9BACT